MSAASPADDGETTGGAFRVDYGIGEEQDSAGSGESQEVEQNPEKAPRRSPRLRDPADEEGYYYVTTTTAQATLTRSCSILEGGMPRSENTIHSCTAVGIPTCLWRVHSRYSDSRLRNASPIHS